MSINGPPTQRSRAHPAAHNLICSWFWPAFWPNEKKLKNQALPKPYKSQTFRPWTPKAAILMTRLCDLDFYFRSGFVTIWISWIATSILRKHFVYHFMTPIWNHKSINKLWFSTPLLGPHFVNLYLDFFTKMVDFGTPSKSSGRPNPPTPAGVRRCQIRECRV